MLMANEYENRIVEVDGEIEKKKWLEKGFHEYRPHKKEVKSNGAADSTRNRKRVQKGK